MIAPYNVDGDSDGNDDGGKCYDVGSAKTKQNKKTRRLSTPEWSPFMTILEGMLMLMFIMIMICL